MNERVNPAAQNKPVPDYFERVLPSFGSFLPTLAVFPTVLLALFPISPIIGYVAGGFLAILAPLLMITMSPTIRISNGNISTSRAKLPLAVISSATVIEKDQAFAERGPKLDSRAYVSFQASAPELIKIELKDAKDPTPYWLLSTRRGVEIKGLIEVSKP
jgi:hypothetical protein